MNIEIIPLALKKMNLRKISADWVKETVESPGQIVSGYMEGEGCFRGFIVKRMKKCY